MHQQKENREIVEKALDLLGLNQSVTRRSFFKLSGITVLGFPLWFHSELRVERRCP